MKIGILTFHNADNYGAVLQCYALQETIRQVCPHDAVCVADYQNRVIQKSYAYVQVRKHIVLMLLQLLYIPARMRAHRQFERFRKQYLNIESAAAERCELRVYGSDQIWNPWLTGNDAVYFGAGYAGKKAAYGASDGGQLELNTETAALLRGFSAISCREQTLSTRLERLLGEGKIQTVCDPVLLLEKEHWLKIAVRPREMRYVVLYRVSENSSIVNETQRFAHRFGRQVIELVYVRGLRTLLCVSRRFAAGVSPQEFLGYIAYADFVCTTSFHGTAFSIVFEKDFYAFRFEKGSERIRDMLSRVGLQDRFIAAVPEHADWQSHGIDWKPVCKQAAAFRKESLAYLTAACHGDGGGYSSRVDCRIPGAARLRTQNEKACA